MVIGHLTSLLKFFYFRSKGSGRKRGRKKRGKKRRSSKSDEEEKARRKEKIAALDRSYKNKPKER